MNADDHDITAAARAKLAQNLGLTDSAWQVAFEEVPRHLFVPYFFDPAGNRISGDDPATREQWLAAVYEDRPLVTQRTNGNATSSASQPSLMAEMLRDLDVHDDHRILEIGTGTGYNAALLSHRVGDHRVVTTDLTNDITNPAIDHLAAAGYRPLVVTGDGALGWRPGALYDRIIATCRLDAVPLPLLDQVRDTGFMLAPLGNAIARIYRTGDQAGEGRFLLGGAFFMPLRRTGEDGGPVRRPELPTGPVRPSELPADQVVNNTFRFLASIVEPGLTWQYDLDDDRKPTGARVWSADGSLAQLHGDGTVSEVGPRSVWTNLEAAHRIYSEAGQPGPERYGVTIADGTQRVWLDGPDGPSWLLTP